MTKRVETKVHRLTQQKTDSINSNTGHLKLPSHERKNKRIEEKWGKHEVLKEHNKEDEICIMWVPKGKVRENGGESLFKEIMTVIFPNCERKWTFILKKPIDPMRINLNQTNKTKI